MIKILAVLAACVPATANATSAATVIVNSNYSLPTPGIDHSVLGVILAVVAVCVLVGIFTSYCSQKKNLKE